jgi:hypothetical protein
MPQLPLLKLSETASPKDKQLNNGSYENKAFAHNS